MARMGESSFCISVRKWARTASRRARSLGSSLRLRFILVIFAFSLPGEQAAKLALVLHSCVNLCLAKAQRRKENLGWNFGWRAYFGIANWKFFSGSSPD